MNKKKEEWSKQPQHIREMDDYEKQVRQDLIDSRGDGYEVRERDGGDAFIKNGDIIGRWNYKDGQISEIIFSTDDGFDAIMNNKRFLRNLPDDTVIHKQGEEFSATAKELRDMGLDKVLITADCAEPKAIQYYNQEGFYMRPCIKYAKSRLENTRKVKRFRKIICSPECVNTIRELQTLTYAKNKQGELIDDEFNIDPHTFSAIWYGLDGYTVADIKNQTRNHRDGDIGG